MHQRHERREELGALLRQPVLHPGALAWLLVAVLGTPSGPAAQLAAFRHGWWVAAFRHGWWVAAGLAAAGVPPALWFLARRSSGETAS